MVFRINQFFGAFLILFSMSCADMQGVDFGRVLSLGLPPDQPTVARGLKQALDVGTERATSGLSTPGGFANNPRVRLGLPGELGTLAGALREVGLGAQVTSFENSMNRAAEAAAARALPIFSNAIASMTIVDAFEILNGPSDAATSYFQQKTSSALRQEFSTAVASSMKDVGLYRAYRDIVNRYDAIPFSKPPTLNLEAYIADQTLEALFSEIAREEARIREDPAARSTALLRRVFGSVSTDSSHVSPAYTPAQDLSKIGFVLGSGSMIRC